MSRLDELKKQYPELNITIFDLMTRLDSSKTYKYLPLMCKLFARRLNPEVMYTKEEVSKGILEVYGSLINKGISTDNLSDKEILSLHSLTEFYNTELFTTLKDFTYYMEQNKIENKDVTSYSSIDDMRGAITLASIKEFTKEMSNQVIKEYEDDVWIAVRPLTFTASAKYGAGTRWCTTYQREKNYFERYWRQGILCYFINKKTGYKFAGFKSLQDKEMNFWNADDSRIDFLDVNIEDYMFTIVKRIYASHLTNKNLCSDEIQEQVHSECVEQYENKIRSIEPIPVNEMVTEQEPEIAEAPQTVGEYIEEARGLIRSMRAQLLDDEGPQMERQMIQREEVQTMTEAPVYDIPTISRG